MICGLFATLAGSAWTRTAIRCGITAIAILLFLLALRRSGERAGRLASAPWTWNTFFARSNPTVIISDMTASQYGLLRSHLGTSMPSGDGYSIKAIRAYSLGGVLRSAAWHS